MLGSFLRNYQMFGQLCGHKAMPNVVFVTTAWDQIDVEVGAKREQQLTGDFWAKSLSRGSDSRRFFCTPESAWGIVDLIYRKRLDALLIQKELVDFEKSLPETAAGATLRKQLRDALKEYEKTVRQRQNTAVAPKGSDILISNYEETQKRYEADEERLREAERKLQVVLDQIQQLKIPIGTRIKRFFGLG